MVARVWKVDEQGEVKIEKVKNFNDILMNSKFNSDAGSLVATGRININLEFSLISVWDCDSCKEVACFDHSEIDPNFRGLEIEWQNNKNVAVAGKSKFIYLWNVDQPKSPIQTWKGHEEDVVQIQWDPTGQLLASCSNDNYVCIWKPDNNQPNFTLKGCGSAVNTIKWSHADS